MERYDVLESIGFEKFDIGKYKKTDFVLTDIVPKNVQKDKTGDIFVIDTEIEMTFHDTGI